MSDEAMSVDQFLWLPATADELRETVEDLVLQFAYPTTKNGVPVLTTGGLSALEGAFAVLGWDDPHVLEKPHEQYGG